MPKKKTKEEIEEIPNIEYDEEIEEILKKEKLQRVTIENILLEISEKYKKSIDEFKDTYHKYQQSGRFVTSTFMRRVKKGQLIIYLNLETDLFIIEKVQYCDGVTVKSKSFDYPMSLVKTVFIKKNFLQIRPLIINVAITNIETLDFAGHLSDLADSVFLKNILKYEESQKILDRPITQIIISGAVFGLVFYFALLKVFEKAIINIIGSLNLIPPS